MYKIYHNIHQQKKGEQDVNLLKIDKNRQKSNSPNKQTDAELLACNSASRKDRF